MNAIRRAIESQYKGICNVYEKIPVTNPTTYLTKTEEVLVLVDQPCKLSFENIKTTNPDGGASTVTQITKLFLAPEIVINPGSKIEVTQQEFTTEYEKSGESAHFTYHQEILLELFEGYA